MATSISNATGLPIRTRAKTEEYHQGWDRIFGKKETEVPVGEDTRPKDRVKLGLSPSTIVEELPAKETENGKERYV